MIVIAERRISALEAIIIMKGVMSYWLADIIRIEFFFFDRGLSNRSLENTTVILPYESEG